MLQDAAQMSENAGTRIPVGVTMLDVHCEELSLEEEGDCLPSEIRDQFVCDQFTDFDGSLEKFT